MTWDRRDEAGNSAYPGIYIVRLATDADTIQFSQHAGTPTPHFSLSTISEFFKFCQNMTGVGLGYG